MELYNDLIWDWSEQNLFQNIQVAIEDLNRPRQKLLHPLVMGNATRFLTKIPLEENRFPKAIHPDKDKPHLVVEYGSGIIVYN